MDCNLKILATFFNFFQWILEKLFLEVDYSLYLIARGNHFIFSTRCNKTISRWRGESLSNVCTVLADIQ